MTTQPNTLTSTPDLIVDAGATASKRGLLRRGWRKMTWVLIAWSALVIVGGLALAGHTSQRLNSSCQQTLGAGSLCQQVGNQAASDQFGHILKLGVIGFLILSVIWFMTRPRPS